MKGKAFVLSNREINKYLLEKYPAFAPAFVADDAEPNSRGFKPEINIGNVPGRYEKCFYNKGYGITRTMKEQYNYGYTYIPYFICEDGNIDWYALIEEGAGMRIACMVKYNKDSKFVKNCYSLKRTSTIWAKGEYLKSGHFIIKEWQPEYTNTVPIIEDNKVKYIWLNKEECERGEDKTMLLLTLDYVACIDAKDCYSSTKNFEKSTLLSEKWAEKHMSDELKQILVTADLSEEIAKPILEPVKTQENIEEDYKY